jgi:hypothetical protein
MEGAKTIGIAGKVFEAEQSGLRRSALGRS